MTIPTVVEEVPLVDRLPELEYEPCCACADSTAIADYTMTPVGIMCLQCQVAEEEILPLKDLLEKRAAILNDELQGVLEQLRSLELSREPPGA